MIVVITTQRELDELQKLKPYLGKFQDMFFAEMTIKHSSLKLYVEIDENNEFNILGPKYDAVAGKSFHPDYKSITIDEYFLLKAVE